MPKHDIGFEVIDEDLGIIVLEENLRGPSYHPTSIMDQQSTPTSQQSTPCSQQSTPCSQQSTPRSQQSKQTSDLIIVGAGVSGLYCLYKILKNDPAFTTGDKTFTMLEQSTVAGGRLRTDIIYSDEHHDESSSRFIACEEGGMRFCKFEPGDQHVDECNEVMPDLLNLIQDLKADAKKYKILYWENRLDTREFKMKPDGLDFRRLWFNGSGFTQWYAAQNVNVYNGCFVLGDKEHGRSPREIFEEVYVRILRENKPRLISRVGRREAEIVIKQRNFTDIALIQTPDYWSYFGQYFTWNSVAINEYTLNSLMTVMGYTQGCIDMLQQSGFQCFTRGRGNAGTIIQMERTHIAISNNLLAFQFGFQNLTDTLVLVISAMLGRDAKDWLKFSRKLITIAPPAKKGRLTRLDVVDISKNTTSCHKITSYTAQDVILAIPRKAFDAITITTESYFRTSAFASLLNSVVDVNMTKVNLYFRCDQSEDKVPGTNAWWNEGQTHRLFGGSSTSLHIAQIYPWYEQTLEEQSPRTTELSALTIYCDVEDSGFWCDLQALPGTFTSPLQEEYPKLVPASIAVVKEALREMELLFNYKNIPYPVLTTYTEWNGDPNTVNPAAIHQWRQGANQSLVKPRLVKPWDAAGVYVCNEAWSGFQGWVEGSLMSANTVLQKLLSQL